MPFGIIGRTGPGMRQVVGFGDPPMHGKGFEVRHCNQWGLIRRTCATVPRPSELRFGVVRAVGRGIAELDVGLRRARRREVSGVFVIHFHNGKCHWVAEGEMFPIRMRKLQNISVRQMYR